MSSYRTSADQSMESATSSFVRSGLNISVGDTKSIVLALQALQQKIRALEQDRDFHQSQHDRALQAHEAYKLDAERQAERERAEHRRREQELSSLLRAAREEKVKLETAVNGSQEDLSAFRAELERMIEEERTQSQQREAKLRAEIARLRQEIGSERAKHDTLIASLEKLRAERQAAFDTNTELRSAIEELQGLRRQSMAATAAATGSKSRVPLARTPPSRRGQNGVSRAGSRRGLSAHSSSAKSSVSHSRLTTGHGHRTYRDPTCNSRLRDVRTGEEDVSCVCKTLSAGVYVGSNSRDHSIGAVSRGEPGGGAPPQRSGTTLAMRMRPASTEASHVVAATAAAGAAGTAPNPMAQVEVQLREELEELQREYRNTVARAAAEDLPRHVVNTALERISEMIDKKEKQLRLMQAARRQIGPATSPSVGAEPPDVTTEKATQRAMLVNELRSMLAEGARS